MLKGGSAGLKSPYKAVKVSEHVPSIYIFVLRVLTDQTLLQRHKLAYMAPSFSQTLNSRSVGRNRADIVTVKTYCSLCLDLENVMRSSSLLKSWMYYRNQGFFCWLGFIEFPSGRKNKVPTVHPWPQEELLWILRLLCSCLVSSLDHTVSLARPFISFYL